MAPTASEIFDRVKAERPPGWRRFTMDHAQRVQRSLVQGSAVGTLNVHGGLLKMADLSNDELSRLSEQVRTNNGAVGVGGMFIFSWLAWKLVEAAVLWAIKWAWRRQWGLDDG
jgi:hypothetical protein